MDTFQKAYTTEVNGVTIYWRIAGEGEPVVLLHGYAQTGHMWLPVVNMLAKNHTVIVPDLRGAGESGKPESGYDKKNMAQDIYALVQALKFQHVALVGHDIGLMVAYAYAAQYSKAVTRLVFMDAFLPGVGQWKTLGLVNAFWHHHLYGEIPLDSVKGQERIYLEYVWDSFAADKQRSIPETDRQVYAEAYAQEGGMRAAFSYFKSLEQDAKDFTTFSIKPLDMPVLVLAGEKASGFFLIEQAKIVAANVKGKIINGAGHWLMEEAPEQVTSMLVEFLK